MRGGEEKNMAAGCLVEESLLPVAFTCMMLNSGGSRAQHLHVFNIDAASSYNVDYVKLKP